jgi:hypothetical protein
LAKGDEDSGKYKNGFELQEAEQEEFEGFEPVFHQRLDLEIDYGWYVFLTFSTECIFNRYSNSNS